MVQVVLHDFPGVSNLRVLNRRDFCVQINFEVDFVVFEKVKWLLIDREEYVIDVR